VKRLYANAAALAAALLASGCASTYQPWINAPAAPGAPSYESAPGGARNSDGIYFVVAFSGGGTRAAALAYGVLEALRGVRFQWDGRETSLLDQVDVLSAVSGGSIAAAYYAAYGPEKLGDFKRRFLLHDFDADLVRSAVSPATSYRLSSPWFGRGNVLADQLDRLLFKGLTYGGLPGGASGPLLLITATDLSLGSSFEFTGDQLRLMCADLSGIPVAVAVAASNAVPVLFSAITLRNYAGECSSALPAPDGGRPTVRRYLDEQATYRDRAVRPYIHLVDGGLADNLGLRRIAQDIEMAGGLGAALAHGGARRVRRIVFLSVNAERENNFFADRLGEVPSLVTMFQAIEFGFLSRHTEETYDLFRGNVARWRAEIRAALGRGDGPFAPDAQIYNIEVGLRSLPDPATRQALLAIATAYSLPPQQVERLIAAAPAMLQADPEYRRLLHDVGADARCGVWVESRLRGTRP
jgi:NTE family protein